jgi:RNA recognition motif-containing protein
MIKGRPCRCEKAKAHRELSVALRVDRTFTKHQAGLFFVERKYGNVVTPEEVTELFSSFGNITRCYTATSVERTALNLNEGVILEFELYDAGQAAFSVSRVVLIIY